MKKYLILLIACCIYNIVFSQKADIQKTPLYEEMVKVSYMADTNPIQADSLIRVLLTRAETDKDLMSIAFGKQVIAVLEDRKGNEDVAYQLLEEAMTHFEEADIPGGKALIFRNLGNMAARTDFEASKTYFEQMLEAAKAAEDERLIAAAYSSLGNGYFRLGDYPKSLENYFAAAEIREKLNDEEGLPRTYSGIGTIYLMQKDYASAETYFKKSLTYFEQQNSQIGIAGISTNLGSVLLNDNRPSEAIPYLRKAYEIFGKINAVRGQATSVENLGKAYVQLDSLLAAIPYLQKALDLFQQMDDRRGIASTSQNLADAMMRKKDYHRAIELYQIGLDYNLETGAKDLAATAYLGLSRAHEQLNQYSLALENFQQYHALNDTLLNENKTEQLATLQTQYETKQKEATIAEQELQIQQQKNQQKNLLIGAILVLLAVGGTLQYLRQRQRLRQKEAELALQLEKVEANNLRELDRMKSVFFANISHEFRTPLTLILSPLEQMIKGVFKGDFQKYYRIMHRNGLRLLQLVNQLLDLSRLESGKMKLQISEGDVAQFVKAIAYSFESLAVRKQIDFQVNVSEQELRGWFDRDKLEKILANLLSNAFKFTPEEGQVGIALETLENEQVQINVRDNGIGIPSEKIGHIFERFYQVHSASDVQAGSGIGLALTKELVELHNGKISVESEQEQGTVFTVVLSIGKQYFATSDFVEIEKTFVEPPVAIEAIKTKEPKIKPLPAAKINQKVLLIVEDNPDVRQYIREQLEGDFQVLEAENGRIGMEKAIESVPDLVITDIMMPEVDGVELSKRLKLDECTSHIPVIMLTAKASQDEKIEGLETGADAYLTKPFDTRELHVRVEKLIEQRRKLQERYQKGALFNPGKVEAPSMDDVFLQKVVEQIEKNLDDETFSVTELGSQIGMSRSQLHRKLKALTNYSPNELIRNMRLERAKVLLEKRAGNASEVAFMVGFNSLAYFSKCFSDYFGVSPSEIS